ncbi:hypothetical protein CHUAL_009912 [Chamberlinius hualienensis]
MEREIFTISEKLRRRYFLRSPASTEDAEWKIPSMSRHCAPLAILLPITGISLEADRKLIFRFLQWIYIFFMLFGGLWYSGIQMYSITKGELSADRIWYFMYSDHYLVVAVAYLAAFKNHHICQIVRKIWRLYHETIDEQTSIKRLQIRAWALFFSVVVFAIIMNGFTIRGITMNTIIQDAPTFAYTYYGFQLNDTNMIEIIDGFSQFLGVFNITLFSIFGCCLIILCFLLKESYAGLNSKLKAKGESFWIDFLHEHQKITDTVENFNEAFSPTILIIIAMIMIQIVALLQSVYKWIVLREIEAAITDIASLTQMLIEFFMLVRYSTDVRNEAQNGIKVLLKVSTANKNQEISEVHEKSCRTINLFIAQTTSSPATISASDLFAVDYSLITFLTTFAISYITLIPLLSEQKGSQPIGSTVSPTSESVEFRNIMKTVNEKA